MQDNTTLTPIKLTFFAGVEILFEDEDMIQFVNESLSSIQLCLVLSHSEIQRNISKTIAPEVGSASGEGYTNICTIKA